MTTSEEKAQELENRIQAEINSLPDHVRALQNKKMKIWELSTRFRLMMGTPLVYLGLAEFLGRTYNSPEELEGSPLSYSSPDSSQ